jgi:hypothetical protein
VTFVTGTNSDFSNEPGQQSLPCAPNGPALAYSPSFRGRWRSADSIVSFDSPFFALLVLAFVSILVIGLLEVLPDRRLAILAVVTMAVACGIAYCTVIIKA